MPLSNNKRISSLIGPYHILWFEESNSWIQFEEPAWFIYKNYQSGQDLSGISQKFSKRFDLTIAESLIFVEDIITEIRRLSEKSYHPEKTIPSRQFKSPKIFFSCRSYLINKKKIEIQYGSHSLEYIIHPSIAHLEIKTLKRPHFKVQAFSTDSKYILKIGANAWYEESANFLKRKLFIALTNLIFNKSEKDWLAYIHSSAVSNRSESIILTTGCGFGKSTLAALLCKSGLQFFSDDYVPIDARFCKAFPFPAALSVKDGSFPVLLPYFEQLKNAEVFHFKGTKKTIRYLPFPDEGNFYKPLPVRSLVFVQYDALKSNSFRKVHAVEAIRRFNEEAWLSPIPSHARKFIKWFPKLNCYELVYSDNEKAISEVLNLFELPY